MEQTECSEPSARKIQTPENHPPPHTQTKQNKTKSVQHSEHGGSLNQDSELYWLPEVACTVRLSDVKLILLYT